MGKTFYTERDIEDLARNGVASIEINNDVVLTEIAREKAERLGIKLVRQQEKSRECQCQSQTQPPASSNVTDLKTRVRQAVAARLGGQVDPLLLDRIIDRVLAQISTK